MPAPLDGRPLAALLHYMNHPRNLAVLIHGLGRTRASMWILSWRLRRRGIRTICVDYPSTRGGIAQSEAILRTELSKVATDTPIDLVGHSLGGFLAGRIKRTPEGLQIGRVVQLGTPNRGTSLSDRLGGLWVVRRACGPAVIELNQFARLDPVHPDIAAIAGTGGWRGIPLPRPHDGAVTARSAWSGAGHRAAVPALHTVLPISLRAATLVAQFLTHGHFERQAR